MHSNRVFPSRTRRGPNWLIGPFQELYSLPEAGPTLLLRQKDATAGMHGSRGLGFCKSTPGMGGRASDEGEQYPPPNALLSARSKDREGSGANIASK